MSIFSHTTFKFGLDERLFFRLQAAFGWPIKHALGLPHKTEIPEIRQHGLLASIAGDGTHDQAFKGIAEGGIHLAALPLVMNYAGALL